MISVVIPTFNVGPGLVHTLAPLVPAVVEGVVQEAIIADGGSTDDTCAIADAAGTHWVVAPRGRGTQLDAGAVLFDNNGCLPGRMQSIIATRFKDSLNAQMTEQPLSHSLGIVEIE